MAVPSLGPNSFSPFLFDTTAAQQGLKFAPKVSLRDGLAAQVAWHEERLSRGALAPEGGA